MKIFVSHAASDKLLVDALQKLVHDAFVEKVEVAYSSAAVQGGGIPAGRSWLEWVRTQIRASDMTIVMLTPLSKVRPWLMWEAGAVSGLGLTKDSATSVVPLLFGLTDDDVPSPLRDRQTKSGTSDPEVRDVLETVRQLGALTYAPDAQLQTSIATYIRTVTDVGIPGMYDLFISCPMTSIDRAEYHALLKTIDRLRQAAMRFGRRSVYSAALNIGKDYDTEAVAADVDLSALKRSRYFVMIYPKRVMSSCILEAGYALLSDMPSTYFVRSTDDLPFMLRGALESYRGKVQRYTYQSEDQIVALFERYHERVIGG